MFNKMVGNSTMKNRSNCFVKNVGTVYSVREGELFPNMHLIFTSEKDYEKIKKIDRMVEK